MKLRLAIASTGIALACAGCALLPSSGIDYGTAQATVTYQADTDARDIEVSIDSIFCDVTRGTGGFITAGIGETQGLTATVSEGESGSLSISLGQDNLHFHSTDPFDISGDGAQFSELPGELMRIDYDDTAVNDVIMVDEAATLTGTVTCP